MEIRPLADADAEAVLDLNEMSVLATSPLDAAALSSHRAMAAEAVVCVVDGQVAAFALAYAPGSAYESVNYQWHCLRFDDFLYLDRIVVSADHRRRGIATAMYDQLEKVATERGRMVCEVNSDPPNPASMAFHLGRGYVEVGRLIQLDGHEVALLEKPL